MIDGTEGKIGEIVHTNNYVKKMLGYKRSECIGTNVNAIMPKVFGEHHNAVLAKYMSISSDKYNGKERIVPALGKDGYMIAVVALTKALPNL
jgi:PAS domain S-box-containing protein